MEICHLAPTIRGITSAHVEEIELKMDGMPNQIEAGVVAIGAAVIEIEVGIAPTPEVTGKGNGTETIVIATRTTGMAGKEKLPHHPLQLDLNKGMLDGHPLHHTPNLPPATNPPPTPPLPIRMAMLINAHLLEWVVLNPLPLSSLSKVVVVG